jgi:hypothetical protein
MMVLNFLLENFTVARLFALSSFAFLCFACVVGCGGGTEPTVTAPPPVPVEVKQEAPTVSKGYDGTVKPPTQEEINAHQADSPGN